MKLSGWYRMGIVLSIVLCFIIIGITIYQYNTPQKRNTFFITLEPDFTKPIQEAPRVEAPCGRGYNCEEGDPYYQEPQERKVYYENKPVVNYGNVFLSMIITVVLEWFLILSIMWVIRGFKNKEPR